ncbi:MAG: HDIG domain-containing protein [Clostridiales bacterium]|nr:HDIG domain-containing protein [Clostridiales bacterium]
MAKTKEEKFKTWNTKLFLAVQPIVVICTFIVSLVLLYALTDFMASFRPESVSSTVSLFIANFIMFELLYLSHFAIDAKRLQTFSDYLLNAIIVTITAVSCAFVFKFVNVFAMPFQLVALLAGVLISVRSAIASIAVLFLTVLLDFLLLGGFTDFDALRMVSALSTLVVSSCVLLYLISKHYTRIKFIMYSLIAALSTVPLAIVATIGMGELDINILYNVLFSLLSGVLSLIMFLPLISILDSIFIIPDDFKLDEICNLNHPLLKRLASEAPGTFNHSLVVGTLAESCAMAIGENPRLAKAAAYYHDVGKLKAPIYYIENQSNYNPHDELIPEVSVSMITSHTMFGEILNREFRLPKEIIQVAKEHHGTSPVGYFYQKALKLTEGSLSTANYRYPGPLPSTKISAIIMISDTIEAATRAYMPPTRQEFEERINALVDEKVKLRQFDECPITLEELNVIKRTIINVLPSIHHSRVSYGEVKPKQ